MSEPLSQRLLNQMQNEVQQQEGTSIDEYLAHDNEVQYEIIPGLRADSELLWDSIEQQLYYYNSISRRTNNLAYKCQLCNARIYMRPDGTAFRNEHSVHRAHTRQYDTYKLMYCHNRMKDKVLASPSSKSLKDIFNEVVKE